MLNIIETPSTASQAERNFYFYEYKVLMLTPPLPPLSFCKVAVAAPTFRMLRMWMSFPMLRMCLSDHRASCAAARACA